MTRKLRRRLHVEGRDDWYLNPATWIVVVSFGTAMYVSGVTALAVVASLLFIVAVNVSVDYESTETVNTNPNQ